MKYLFTLTMTVIITVQTAFTQTWLYTQHIAPITNAQMRGVTLDLDSNLYITAFHRSNTGVTNYTGPFGTKTYSIVGNAQDILLIKLDPDGDTIWTKAFGGTGSDYPRQVAINSNNDPYIAGIFRSPSITIQASNLTNYSSGTYDIFLAKYTADGANGFAKRVAFGPDDQELSQIEIDNAGNIYMAGSYTNQIYFATDTLTAQQSTFNLFLAKFTPNGDLRWAKNIVSDDGSSSTTNFIEISVANNEEIYLGGFFRGTLSADGISITSQGTAEDMLIMKVDSSGATQWMRMGGSNNLADRCNGITTSTSGDIYITGYFQGSAKFDSTGRGLLNSSSIISAGGFDMFMAKYSPSGRLLWKRQNGSTGNDIAYGAKIRENIVQFTGYFCGTLTFNNTTISSGSATNEDTGFFIYDTDGNPITAKSIQGAASDRGEYIEYGLKGNTYIGGYFQSATLSIGSTILTKRSAAGNSDAFVAKYHNPFSATFSTHINITCPGGNDGKLLVTSYFGTEPYIYDWSASTGTGNFSDSVASNLTAGYYEVLITDSRDSVVIVNYTLIDPADFNIILDSTNLSCYQSGDGAITASATGGTDSLTYSWSGPGVSNPNDQNQNNLIAGLYKLTITDASGCKAYDSIEVTQPDPIYFGNVVVSPEDPSDSHTGSINLDVSGGTQPYTYSWAFESVPMPGRISDTLNNLQEGLYTAHVNDGNGCSADTNIIVPGDSLRVSMVGINTSCYNVYDGWAWATIVSGDVGYPYTYAFEDGLHNPLTPVNDSVIIDLSPGWYYVTINEQGGENRTASDSVEIIQPAEIIFQNIEIISPSCIGTQDASLIITPGGGAGAPYQYSIDNGFNYSADSLFVGLTAQTYHLRILDANDCESADSLVSIMEPEGSTMTSPDITNVTCNGYDDGSIVISASNPVGGLTYSIDNGSSFIDNAGIFNDLVAGTYQLWIRDGNGCSQQFSVVTLEGPVAISLDTNVQHAVGDQNGEVMVIATGGTSPYNFTLYSGVYDSTNTTGQFNDLFPGEYSAFVIDNNLCNSDTLEISILQTSTQLVIYDAFSPNNDGRNDVWNIGNIGLYPNCKVTIFNTWGNTVFTSNGYTEAWDGKYNGKVLPAGTYYYIIDLGDGSDPVSGPVSIVR